MVQSGRTVSLVAKYRPPMPILVRRLAAAWPAAGAAAPLLSLPLLLKLLLLLVH